MATPVITDFILYTTVPLTDTDYEYNWTKLVSYLTDGTEDITVNSVTGDLIGNVTGDVTGNITGSVAGSITYSAPVTRYKSISAAAFVVEGNTAVSNDGYRMRVYSGTSGITCYASVQLPHGATVTLIKLYGNRTAGSLTQEFHAHALSTGSQVFADGAGLINSGSGYQSSQSGTLATVIDNTANSYWLYVRMAPSAAATDVYFYSAMITYTVTVPLP